MVVHCPRCKFTATLPDSGPSQSKRPPSCPRCQTLIPVPGRDDYSLPLPTLDNLGNAQAQVLSWEVRSSWLDLAAFWKTTFNILFHPSATFTGLNYGAGIRDSLVYALVYGSLGQIIGRYWFTLLAIQYGFVEADVVMNTSRFAAETLFTPVLFTAALFFASGLVHLALWILGGAKRSFGATFQVIAYVSGAVSLVNVVPILGSVLMPIWALILDCIGLSAAHKASRIRVFFAIMLPFILAAFLLAVVMLFVATFGMLHLLDTFQQRL